MKHLIALSTLLFALNAAAGCPSSMPSGVPEIPDGSTANKAAMLDAMVAVQAYVANIEAFLHCRDLELTDGSYNQFVDRAIDAADSYNRELQRYQRQDGMLAKF